jgi:polysaccharide biosynthesis protein PslH
MNILVISPLLPYPPDSGGISRLYNIYTRLAKKHRLTWLCPIWAGTEAYISEAERICDRVVELPRDWHPDFPERGWGKLSLSIVAHIHWERLFVFCYDYVQAPGLYWLPPSPERLALVSQILSSSNFDLVVCEFEGSANLVSDGVDIPKIVVLHNTQSTLFRRARQSYDISWQDRLFFWPELLKITRYEARSYSRFDLAVVVSEADQQLLHKRCPRLPTELIPNCVDLSFFLLCADPGTSRTLLYFGHYGYPPNADAILYFCQEMLPLIRQKIPDVQVLVAGRQPPDELAKYPGVQVLGLVPDIRTCLAQADVVIAPLRIGGGTRIKILEALAAGKAVVSTRLGAEGLKVTHGENILLADEPAEFADCVVHLLEQPALRSELGRNGRGLVEQHYDWDAATDRLDEVFRRVVDDGGQDEQR